MCLCARERVQANEFVHACVCVVMCIKSFKFRSRIISHERILDYYSMLYTSACELNDVGVCFVLVARMFPFHLRACTSSYVVVFGKPNWSMYAYVDIRVMCVKYSCTCPCPRLFCIIVHYIQTHVYDVLYCKHTLKHIAWLYQYTNTHTRWCMDGNRFCARCGHDDEHNTHASRSVQHAYADVRVHSNAGYLNSNRTVFARRCNCLLFLNICVCVCTHPTHTHTQNYRQTGVRRQRTMTDRQTAQHRNVPVTYHTHTHTGLTV